MKFYNNDELFKFNYCIAFVLLAFCHIANGQQRQQCGPEQFVYGENGIIDELTTCALVRSFDLDLTPHSSGNEHNKTVNSSPHRSLIDQGLSNKTSILHARLSGLWTLKRANFIETGWKCEHEGTISSSALIEVTNLSLEVIEKLDISLHKSHHQRQQQQNNLNFHKPCKTFDLPVWMCRDQKSIYRTVTTWVNRAYFQLNLIQHEREIKPTLDNLSLIFTCPETFNQKINYSPSATYVLTRQLHSPSSSSSSGFNRGTNRKFIKKRQTLELPTSSHTIKQSGKQPAVPPYHNSVRIIQRYAIEALKNSLNFCINSIDCDLNLIAQHHRSFKSEKYNYKLKENKLINEEVEEERESIKLLGECSSENWLKNRYELFEQANSLTITNNQQQQQKQKSDSSATHSKRSQFLLDYPNDPNQLLNPYGFYHENSALDQMIDDNENADKIIT